MKRSDNHIFHEKIRRSEIFMTKVRLSDLSFVNSSNSEIPLSRSEDLKRSDGETHYFRERKYTALFYRLAPDVF